MSTETFIQPLRFAVLGFGHHARSVFLPVIHSLPTATLSVIATRDKQRANDIRSTLDNVEVLECYEQLLERDDIDAVYIALPNHLHAEWTVRCLMAGLHVLCEKPIALTVTEEEAINSTSISSCRQVVEGFAYRFHPQHQIFKDLLTSGAIGEIKELVASYSYNLTDLNNIRMQSKTAGGALNDVGCYLLDLYRLHTKDAPVSFSVNPEFRHGIDVSTQITLLSPEGINFKLYCSCTSPRTNCYQAIGTDGTITLRSAFHVPRNMAPKIELKRFGKPTEIITAPKHNQFLSLVEYFCSRVNSNDPTDLGITSNAKLLERARETR